MLRAGIALARAFDSPCHSRPNGRRIGNQIDTAMIFARADFVNVITLQSMVSKDSGAERELGEVSGLGIAASMSGKEPARTKRC